MAVLSAAGAAEAGVAEEPQVAAAAEAYRSTVMEAGSCCCSAAEVPRHAWTASPFVLPEYCLPRCSGSPAQDEGAGAARPEPPNSSSDKLQGEPQIANSLLRCFSEGRFWSIDRKSAPVQQHDWEKQQHDPPHAEEEEELLPPLFRLFLKYSCNLTLVGERVLGAHLQLLPLVICASPADLHTHSSSSATRDDTSRDSKKYIRPRHSVPTSLCNSNNAAHSRGSSRRASGRSCCIEEHGPHHLEDADELAADLAEDAWASLLSLKSANDASPLHPATKRRVGSAAAAAGVDTRPGAAAAGAARASDAATAEHGKQLPAAEHSSEGAASGAPRGAPPVAAARYRIGDIALSDSYLRHIRLHVPGPLAESIARFYRSADDASAVPLVAGSTQMTAAPRASSFGVAAAASATPASIFSADFRRRLSTGDKDGEETLAQAFSYGMLLLRLSALRPRVRAAVLKASVPFGRVLEQEGVVRRVCVEDKLHIHISQEVFTVGLSEEPALHAEMEERLQPDELRAAPGARDAVVGDAAPAAAAGRENRIASSVPAGEEKRPGCTCEFLSVAEGCPEPTAGESTSAGIRGKPGAAAGGDGATRVCAGVGGPTATTGIPATAACLSPPSPQKTAAAAAAGAALFTMTSKTRRLSLAEGRRKEAAATRIKEGRRQVCTFGRWSVMMCDGRPAARVLEIVNAPLILAAAAAAVSAGGHQQQDRGAGGAKECCSNSTAAEDPRTAGGAAATGSTQAASAPGAVTATAARGVGAVEAVDGAEGIPAGAAARDDGEHEEEKQILKDLEHLQRVCLCSASCCPVHQHWLQIPLLWGPPAAPSHSSTAAHATRGAAPASCVNVTTDGNVDRTPSTTDAGTKTAAAGPATATVEAADTCQSSKPGVVFEKISRPSAGASVGGDQVLVGGVAAATARIHGSRPATADSAAAAATATSSAAGVTAAAASPVGEGSASVPADSSIATQVGNYTGQPLNPCFNCKSTVCVTKFSRDAQGRILV